MHYSNFDDAVSLVRQLGRGCFMAKCDIDSAFRIIPINPLDYSLLGFKFQNKFYFDRCLPMGASSACNIFDRFSSGLKWIAQTKLNIKNILHILDDFLILSDADEHKCKNDLLVFLGLCKTLGVPIKQEKTEFPTTVITFMGLELDSVNMVARLPQDKLIKLRSLLSSFRKRRKVKLQELQSLLGLLNFCCKVVLPGRAFLRRLIDLTKGLTKAHHRVTLNKEGRKDIEAWWLFLEHFNGSHILLDQRWVEASTLHLFTDASGSLGYGALFKTHWCYGIWPNHLQDFPITFKELFPITLAIELWGCLLSNKCMIIHSDNMAVVHIINNQTCKDNSIMFLVRRLVLGCMKYNLLVHAKHIPGKLNTLADMLSRSQIPEFKKAAPYMDQEPTPIPANSFPHL